MADVSKAPVNVSGGVSSIKDIENLQNIEKKNIEGIIV